MKSPSAAKCTRSISTSSSASSPSYLCHSLLICKSHGEYEFSPKSSLIRIHIFQLKAANRLAQSEMSSKNASANPTLKPPIFMTTTDTQSSNKEPRQRSKNIQLRLRSTSTLRQVKRIPANDMNA